VSVVYTAACRNETCLWHRAPAEFTDYGERASAVGQHRVQTGHHVDMDSREIGTEEDAEREAEFLDLETELLEHEFQVAGRTIGRVIQGTVCKCGETPDRRPDEGDWVWWVRHVVKVMG
jgi:hypothetical protein